MLAGCSADRLIISKCQYELLNKNFSCLKPSEINLLVDEAIEKIIDDLGIDQAKPADYIRQYKTILIRRILNAVENGSLHNIILTDNEEKIPDSGFIFAEGDRMNGDSFRSAIGRIMKCISIADKIDAIKSSIHSLGDFIDVLNADCLFGDEFTAVFSTLSDMELSVLGRTVFYEELRDGPLNLSTIISTEKEFESEWQTHYIGFIQKLNKDRIESIEKFINDLITCYD